MFAYMSKESREAHRFINLAQTSALGEILDSPPAPNIRQCTRRLDALAYDFALRTWIGQLWQAPVGLAPGGQIADWPRLSIAVRAWSPDLSGSFQEFEQRRHADKLANALTFLSAEIGSFPADGFKRGIADWLQELTEVSRFDCAVAAAADEEGARSGDEVDRNHRYMQSALETQRVHAGEYDRQPAQLLTRLRQLFHRQLLNVFAEQLAAVQPYSTSGLKLMLALQPGLNTALQLGFPPQAQEARNADIVQSLLPVFERAEKEHFKTWLPGQPAWLAWVRRTYREEAGALKAKYLALGAGLQAQALLVQTEQDVSARKQLSAVGRTQRLEIYGQATKNFPCELSEMALGNIGIVGEPGLWLAAQASATATGAATAPSTTTTTTTTTTTVPTTTTTTVPTTTTTTAPTTTTSTTATRAPSSSGEQTEGAL